MSKYKIEVVVEKTLNTCFLCVSACERTRRRQQGLPDHLTHDDTCSVTYRCRAIDASQAEKHVCRDCVLRWRDYLQQFLISTLLNERLGGSAMLENYDISGIDVFQTEYRVKLISLMARPIIVDPLEEIDDLEDMHDCWSCRVCETLTEEAIEFRARNTEYVAYPVCRFCRDHRTARSVLTNLALVSGVGDERRLRADGRWGERAFGIEDSSRRGPEGDLYDDSSPPLSSRPKLIATAADE